MNGISLLLCKSATERHDELNSWLYVALAAMVFVIVGAGAELIVLEIAFVLALCLRQGAALSASVIRKSVNVINSIGVTARTEARQVQRSAAGINHVTTVTARRRSSESRQACFASLGLPHLCLASRLLPLPISIARQ
jgi:hypothetical protein